MARNRLRLVSSNLVREFPLATAAPNMGVKGVSGVALAGSSITGSSITGSSIAGDSIARCLVASGSNVLVAAFFVTAAMFFSGCNVGFLPDSGSSGGGVPGNPTDPRLVGVVPAEGAPGDVVLLQGFNFPLDIADNEVIFTAAAGEEKVEIPGSILSITKAGASDPTFGQQTAMEVVVPNGVRSGLCSLTARTASDVIFAGAVGFTGTPQIVTVAMGSGGGTGRVIITPTLGYLDSDVQFVGYNLETITACSVLNDATGDPIESPGVTLFAPIPPATSWKMPDGMTACSVTIPDIELLGIPIDTYCLDGDAHPFRFTLESTMPSGEPFSIGPIVIQFHGPLATLLPAHITSVLTPSGVRSGNFTIYYNLYEIPCTSRWDILPEFELPGGDWARCAPATSSFEGRDVVPGGWSSGPNLSCFLGPGQLTAFTWNTRDTTGGGLPDDVSVTRLRLTPENPEDGITIIPCESGPWTTGPIVIDNSAPLSGEVRESFDSDIHLESATAVWNTAAGLLQGVVIADTTFGTGLNDILLEAGQSYIFNTDNGSASSEGEDPVDLFPGDENPGRLSDPPEFWMRSFTFELGASIRGIGSNPLVIRCSGTGNDADVVALIQGSIQLNGANGNRPQPDPPETPIDIGDGGNGNAGGGNGGDGGVVVADGENTPGVTITQTEPLPGLNFGGGAGQNVDNVKDGPTLNSPKAGPGGGGGHATKGGDGLVNFSAATVQGKGGRGGPPRGDAELTRMTAGAGGGGGGGIPFRSPADGDLVS